MRTKKLPIARGFNLVEIAVVLLIFSLLVGGVLRGEELISSAKARNLIDQKGSFQTAFTAFSNRYKLMAGDLTAAQASFVGAGVVASTTCAGDGLITIEPNITAGCANPETILVFQNLTATGFLSCANCLLATANGSATANNTFNNSYGRYLEYGSAPSDNGIGSFWLDPTPGLVRNMLSTGSKYSSAILQQADLKADDGLPHTGTFRRSTVGYADTCTTTNGSSTVFAWATTVNVNCAGAWLF
jgi:prepilin-type N-terminal cleavage/methylation domain-containing protein